MAAILAGKRGFVETRPALRRAEIDLEKLETEMNAAAQEPRSSTGRFACQMEVRQTDTNIQMPTNVAGVLGCFDIASSLERL